MGTYGGFAPQPERYGGGKTSGEQVHDALLHADSKLVGLSTEEGTYAWIEDLALARAIAAAWSTNARGANEFDPRRTQSMLPRWESVFGLVPLSTDSLVERRSTVTFKWEALGKDPRSQSIVDDLVSIGGPVFVEVLRSTTGPSFYPGSTDPNPYDPSGLTTATTIVNWFSGAMNLCVRCTRPAGMIASTYEAIIGEMGSYLDGALMAWSTFSIGQFAHAGSAGFYLDEANFDLAMLDG